MYEEEGKLNLRASATRLSLTFYSCLCLCPYLSLCLFGLWVRDWETECRILSLIQKKKVLDARIASGRVMDRPHELRRLTSGYQGASKRDPRAGQGLAEPKRMRWKEGGGLVQHRAEYR